MATHYTAEQYDQEFNPKRLQMYEIAKPCLSKVPPKRDSEITFISNEKGHLNPGVRRSETNPFGDYVGTWDLPKTGRSNKNVEELYTKKRDIENQIKIAQENNKPMSLKADC